MPGYVSEFKAVLYKALCSRRYHYLSTAFDILLPLVFVYFLVAFKGNNNKDDIEGEKIFPLENNTFILTSSYENNLDILYAPNTSEVHSIMVNVKKKLNPHKIDVFRAMKNESEMEKWFYLNSNETQWNDGYGLVFNQLSNNSLQYSIRSNKFDIWNTNLRYPAFQYPGPMEDGTRYLRRGFIALQIAIDEAFMEFNNITPVIWNLQEFPYPEYKKIDQFELVYKEVLPFLLCYGYLYSIISLIKNIGEEKESGIRERLKMSGVRPWISYLGWLIDSGVVSVISSAGVTVVLTASWLSKTGAFLEKSNFFIIWITVFLFYVLGNLQAFTVATVFTKPRYSTTVGLALWMITYGFFSYVSSKASSLTLFLISMLPTGFLLTSTNAIIHFEVLGEGATFKTLFEHGGSDGVICSLGFAWIASLCGMITLYEIISYLDVVFPGPYGVPLPWYFIFPQKCWRSICKVGPNKNVLKMVEEGDDEVDDHIKDDDKLKESKINYEPLLGSLPVGIKISKLSKQYGSVLALNKFSIDIYKHQITALLGHNGAGKTTLLSVITGMLPPTEGEVYTDEYDVFSNLHKFRSDLGYCPQNDLLLPNLTVAEHIMFFGLMKGFSRNRAKEEAESIMLKCRLSEKNNTRVAELSGGMRRKLCLAVSLVNDPKILILDEPTSGLDPESRRAIWDILLELRKGRTLLITTHFMEEADVLGDRIAIMSHGELKCYGTSLFLKKNYGSGYHVTILLSPGVTDDNIKELISIVTSEIPETCVISESLENVTLQLPLNRVSLFPSLFYKLENRNDLGVASLAVSCTTIDDVFQKVNEEEGVKYDVDEVDMPVPYNPLRPSSDYTTALKTPFFLSQRLFAIGTKKVLWIYRNLILALLYFILPLMIVVLITYKSTNTTTEEDMGPLLLNLKLYEKSKVLITNISSKYAEPFQHEVNEYDSQIVPISSGFSIVEAILQFARKDEANFRTSLIVAGDMKENSPTILYSSIGIHSLPIAVNLISNTIVNAASPSANYSISTYNYPYTFNSDSCSRGESEVAVSASYTIGLIMALTVLFCFFIIPVHSERISLFKELQLMTGLQYPFYWLYTFIIDYIIYICIFILLLLIMIIFDSSGMFHSWNMIGAFSLTLCLFGISSLWSVYFYSFFFKTYNGSTLFYSTISTALCLIGVIVYGLLGYTKWKYLFYLNPINPAASAIYKIFSEAKFDIMCEICKGPAVTMMCEAKRNTDYIEDFDYGTELYYLGFDWVCYLAVIFSIECGLISFVWHIIKTLFIGKIPESERPLDSDVFQEKTKVKSLANKEAEENVVLLVNGLAKKYSRSVLAVKDVTFAVPQGQCFGLLGTNGAGKSTTFQMLTGYILPTNGDASACGYTLSKNRNKYKLQIGYCPQSGGLLGDLTGKETLGLFANLRGVPSSEVNTIVQKWIRLLGLTEYENRPTSTYSGGNLRKLSTAIALIGNPPLVFLDEPTTGVDPVTRRKIWKVLKKVQDNNQTIVITSHSMDECEALCDRLTILVHGTMKCIGNIQYLKKTYGKGFTIIIKLGAITSELLVELKQRVETLFSHNCTLVDEHKGLLHYHLDDPKCFWSTLFKNMAELKTEFNAVEDYVLTDSSLEQVFLSFASENQ